MGTEGTREEKGTNSLCHCQRTIIKSEQLRIVTFPLRLNRLDPPTPLPPLVGPYDPTLLPGVPGYPVHGPGYRPSPGKSDQLSKMCCFNFTTLTLGTEQLYQGLHPTTSGRIPSKL
eukprot:3849148-Rhodomonas_salina.1